MKAWNTRYAGQEAGTPKAGYLSVSIDDKLYRAHRVIFLMVEGRWPTELIDHRDLDRANNRWGNLREATHAQDKANRPATAKNKLGLKGVNWSAKDRRYVAYIRINGRSTHLGHFRDPKAAAAAYAGAARAVHGEFAHRARPQPAGGSAAVFQQAKTPSADEPAVERFLQVEKRNPLETRQKLTRQHKLTRVPFQVSRLMEFCSLRELQNQTGHQVWDWPLVVLKELLDNALDAAEEAGVAPVIKVSVSPKTGTIIVEDNGPGIPAETIGGIINYSIRVSSREAYVSPSRGAQGNALKTVLAMGYVLDQERLSDSDADVAEASGQTIIETGGAAHTITFLVDHVTNEPRITHSVAPSSITVGTKVTVQWPAESKHGYGSLLDNAEGHFKALASSYTWFNPHVTLTGTWDGAGFINVEATNPDWTKWRPSDPTSPHWYSDARLQRYMSAHVARDLRLGQDRPVREFVAEFRGLSGTQKQKAILEEIGASRLSLRSFFGEEKVNRAGIGRLLKAMKSRSAPVPPTHLGVIGKEHLKARFLAAGGAEETFKYERSTGVSQGLPYIVECAFGLRQSGLDGADGRYVVTDSRLAMTGGRLIITGANWSVGIQNPFRRFGKTGEGLESTLAAVRANANQPVIMALHLASAHIQYADRGKSSIIVDGDVEAADV